MHTTLVRNEKQSGTDAIAALGKRCIRIIIGALVVTATLPLLAQNEAVQQKLAEVKKSVAENNGRREGPSHDVRAARPAENASGLQGRKAVIHSRRLGGEFHL